ncbi:MAG: ATP-binding protein [Bacilli bacterium]|nr:ATP-binding protein [Bacilli bacterium]MBN2877273.1 ATP-binding protein [Bacilli bacterium]
MFKSFYVENYKSWKSPVSIDMTAQSISEHPYNVITENNQRFVKNLLIYGANASGKSNLLDAIDFMYEKVMEIYNEREWNRSFPPELKNNSLFSLLRFKKPNCSTYAYKNTPSIFEITVIMNGVEYSYGFEIKQQRIINEWLDKGKKAIFDRKSKDFKNISEYTFITDKVPDDQLFLSHLIAYAKIDKHVSLRDISNFFIQMGVFKDFEKLDPIILNALLINLLNTNKKIIDQINGFFEIIDFGIERMEYDPTHKAICFLHRAKNEAFKIYLPEESLGTKKMLLVLVGVLFRLETGGLIVADEFTSSLHPLLSKLLFDAISDPDMNKGNAQIIITTHDIFFMTKEEFRRDEIGFVYKDKTGESHFSRLYDMKDDDMVRVRKDSSYWKNYIKGAYEGTPDIDYDLFVNEEGVMYGKVPNKKKQ